MSRQPVTSSAIRAIGYEPEQRILEVEFTTGSVYRYLNVPKAQNDALLEAPSKGAHFNHCIRRTYPCEKVPNTDS